MGTHTSGAQQDYLQIAQVQIPNQVGGDDEEDDLDDEEDGDGMGREAYDDERGGMSTFICSQLPCDNDNVHIYLSRAGWLRSEPSPISHPDRPTDTA